MRGKTKRIRFLTFVNSLQIEDEDIKKFQAFCLRHNKGIIRSSNPHLHAKYLMHYLPNHEQLIGYFKCMVEYFEHPGNMLPAELVIDKMAFLNVMQRVVGLLGPSGKV